MLEWSLHTILFNTCKPHLFLGLQYMNTALQYDPKHKEALLNSAILIQVHGTYTTVPYLYNTCTYSSVQYIYRYIHYSAIPIQYMYIKNNTILIQIHTL